VPTEVPGEAGLELRQSNVVAVDEDLCHSPPEPVDRDGPHLDVASLHPGCKTIASRSEKRRVALGRVDRCDADVVLTAATVEDRDRIAIRDGHDRAGPGRLNCACRKRRDSQDRAQRDAGEATQRRCT